MQTAAKIVARVDRSEQSPGMTASDLIRAINAYDRALSELDSASLSLIDSPLGSLVSLSSGEHHHKTVVAIRRSRDQAAQTLGRFIAQNNML